MLFMNYLKNKFFIKYKWYIIDRVDISEGIDVNKTSESKECNICHYW